MKKPFYRQRLFLWPVGIVFGLVFATFIAFAVSPWPGALLVRHVFNSGDKKSLAALQKYTPSTPIAVISNQQYIQSNHDALLDVYIPQSAEQNNKTLPVVIWTHGGAWVSGDKSNESPYFKQLASHGYIMVSLNYTLAPEKKYPAQIFEINDAHAYILANAHRFHIDSSKIFLAGDSAGAQLTSQMSALITNPAYAKVVGIKPTLQSSQVRGTVLFCGIYKMRGLAEADPNLPKLISWGDDQVVWAFSGTRNSASPIVHQMSPYYYVTKDFPATFISGGNGDPLTPKQSVPLANKLTSLGVSVDSLFYDANHQPSLPHEYQFNLNTHDAQQALADTTQFLQKQTQ